MRERQHKCWRGWAHCSCTGQCPIRWRRRLIPRSAPWTPAIRRAKPKRGYIWSRRLRCTRFSTKGETEDVTTHAKRFHAADLLLGGGRIDGKRAKQIWIGKRTGARHTGLQGAGVHFHVRRK